MTEHEHLLACEARYVMNMTSEQRDRFLANVEAKRGKAAADELLQRARDEWRKAKRAA